MVERGSGKIINVVSLLSFQGGVKVVPYTSSKHAVAGITRALANEWGSSGVQVNAIAPGYIATANTAPSAPTHPVRRRSARVSPLAGGAAPMTWRVPWSSLPTRVRLREWTYSRGRRRVAGPLIMERGPPSQHQTRPSPS